jgi:hypothetical protein
MAKVQLGIISRTVRRFISRVVRLRNPELDASARMKLYISHLLLPADYQKGKVLIGLHNAYVANSAYYR